MADMINVKINGIAVSVPKGTTVFAGWSGFLIESKHAVPYPGTEDQFGFRAADALKNKEKVKKYKLFSLANLPALIRKKEIKLFIFNNQKLISPEIIAALDESGYKKKAEDFIYLLEDN